MKVIKLLFVLIGLVSFGWGANLIHETYVHDLDTTIMMKTGDFTENAAITDDHRIEALKTLIVHLGLIVLGTILFISPILRWRRT